MVRKNSAWAILWGSLVVLAAPAMSLAAEPAAQHVSAWDAKVVCRRVQKPDSRAKERECATREQWRARRDLKVVCLWGRPPGAEGKEQFCATVAQWHEFGIRTPIARSLGSIGSQGTSPSVPGNTNFGTAASQSSFQR